MTLVFIACSLGCILPWSWIKGGPPAALATPHLFGRLLSPDFMPHGYCYLWDPAIVWLHVISDILTAISYFCIPIALACFVRRRRDLPFSWVFWMFGIFITSLPARATTETGGFPPTALTSPAGSCRKTDCAKTR